MFVLKRSCVTQARTVLITSKCAKTCFHFLPLYESNDPKNFRGVLLDLVNFSKPVNFSKYQINQNNLIFNEYTAMFRYESDIVNYDLCRTSKHFYSRISTKVEISKIAKSKSDLDEISPAEVKDPAESFSGVVNRECDTVLLENVLRKRDSNENFRERERNTLVRITILYTLGFFALASATFFVIYLA